MDEAEQMRDAVTAVVTVGLLIWVVGLAIRIAQQVRVHAGLRNVVVMNISNNRHPVSQDGQHQPCGNEAT